VTREKIAKERGLKPVGRIVSWAVAGVDPSIMGIGPVPSSQKALKLAGLTLEQMDRVEVNEAFAAQYLAVEKVLGLKRDKTNVNGGAIALGHPLGASGTRLVITILNELRRNGLRYGLATACIGGGQGIAMVVERLPTEGRRLMRKYLAFNLLFLCWSVPALAFCGPPRLICGEYAHSEAVVEAKLIRIQHFFPKNKDKQDWFIYTLESTQITKEQSRRNSGFTRKR